MPVNDKAFRQFACRVCGDDTSIAFCEPTAHDDVMNGKAHFQAWCERHCPGHDYEYDRMACNWFCRYCDALPPNDWYDYD